MPNNLLIEGPEQGVQIFTLNRPDSLHTELPGNLPKAGTADLQEGLYAFGGKHKPQFKGQ